MEIRNRMSDVVKLRCNACQDFLKMILIDNWQEELYRVAQDRVEKGPCKDKYRDAYNKMRDIGYSQYSAEMMDVSFIHQIVQDKNHKAYIKSINEKTLKALTIVKNDRNLKDHSNENEEASELYLRGLLALCNLEFFVKTVDQFEKSIDDDCRLSFRQKYMHEIKTLMECIDDERIVLIQRKKSINRDIQDAIKKNKWKDLWHLYGERYRYEKNREGRETYNEFMIASSDAGVTDAHIPAADAFIELKDDEEATRRIFMFYNASDKMSFIKAHIIVSTINACFNLHGKITSGMKQLLDKVRGQGYPVKEDENGYRLISSTDSNHLSVSEARQILGNISSYYSKRKRITPSMKDFLDRIRSQGYNIKKDENGFYLDI